MIERILRFSLERRWVVLAAAVALMSIGIWRALSMRIDVFPDLTAPQVTVVTEVTGMAPQEIEQLVTFPIETAVNGVAGVRRVRSASAAGLSIVWVEFDWSTTSNAARQRVAERLQTLEALPPEAHAPSLAPPSSVMGEIAFVALESRRVDELELRRIAEVDVRRRVLAIAGISQVVIQGGEERQYQVLADRTRLARYGLTLNDLAAAIEEGSENAPGGFLVEGGQESLVRVLGRARDADDLAAIAIGTRDGVPILVRDVATVSVGAAPRRGSASYRARPAVVLSIQKQPGTDTIDVTERVDAELDEIERDLRRRGVRVHRDIFRQSTFIHRSVDNLLDVLRDGAALVVVVLLIFLWSVRATVISVLAIPLSLVATVLVLHAFDLSLDTMTLGGLAIAIGELVDDAIVDVENVVRRLRERAALPEADRAPILDVVLHASLEIRTSIVSATLVVILVFLPLFFLEGLEGRLLRPLAVAYVTAIFASLVVALTVTPALAMLLLPRSSSLHRPALPPPLRALDAAYTPILRRVISHPRLIATGAAIVLGLAIASMTQLGRSFLPEFNEGSLTISVITLPGTSLDQSDALGRMAEEQLLADPAVVSTMRRTGRAERDEHVQGVEASEIEVMLRQDGRDREQLLEDLRAQLAAVPGVQVTIGQPISHRIEHMISGQRTSLSIKVVGEDLDALRRTADQVKEAVHDVRGLVDVGVEPIVDVPQTTVRIDRAGAARHGLSPGAAASAVGTALWGRVVGRIYERGLATEVVVRDGDERLLRDREALERLQIPTPRGLLAPVREIAEVRPDRAPNYILRENVARRVVVTANVAGRDLGSVVDDVRARVRERVRLPPDTRIDYAGLFERQEAATRRLLFLGSLAVLGIALIVGVTLRSVPRTLIVLVNLPLALAGGVAGVWLTGGVLSVASIIGFITLFGIATRNGIMLATHAQDLEASGIPYPEAVARSARDRIAPILMTAVAAGLGLVPLAAAMGEPGSEIQAPMAVVILCGLASSTALNMIVVPALLARWGADQSKMSPSESSQPRLRL